jgi:integrase/recombinase XerD
VSRADEVYNYPRTLERELAKLRANSVGKKNSETILRFYRQIVAEGIGIARQIKYLSTLRRIASLLNKPFEEAIKDDIIDFVVKIEQQDYSEWTKHSYKIILKKFYKWLRGCEDEYPAEVRWIKARNNIPNTLQKKDLLTVDDIKRIANNTRNIRDKAFIWVYFESMRRLGEILTLKIGDVEFDELGARLLVNGKMGRDHGRVITSVPLLSAWLNMHPLRDDPSSPLWVTLGSKKICKQLSYNAVKSMLKDCAKRAGIKKRVWLYLIRHSRITPASKILPHSLLCATAGWKQGSRMPSVYIHLAGEDVDEAQCMLSGIAKLEKKDKQLKPLVCSRCQNNNVLGSKFCTKCGTPLDLKTSIQLDQTRTKLDRLFNKLTEDPRKLEKLLTLIERT